MGLKEQKTSSSVDCYRWKIKLTAFICCLNWWCPTPSYVSDGKRSSFWSRMKSLSLKTSFPKQVEFSTLTFYDILDSHWGCLADSRLCAMNHRILEWYWVGRNLKDHLVPTPVSWTGTPSTKPGCSKPCPTWPWALPGRGQPQPLWATCSSISPHT